MKIVIKVPAMGESINEVTIGAILKPSGSQVAVDDEIIELETDKVNQVLYASQAGIINFQVSSGEVVKIGQEIGFIDSSASAAPKKEQKIDQPIKAPPTPTATATAPTPSAQSAPTPLSSEVGARASKESFVEEITKPIQKQEAVAPSTSAPAPSAITKGIRSETRRKMSKIRQVIAKRMVEAQKNAAMLTTFNEIDMTQVLMLREKYKEDFNKKYGVKLGFMSFFVKASVAALAQFPDVNSYIDGDEIVHREYYDIGIAVSTDRGLVVPVVRDCDQLSFSRIEQAIEAYAKKARSGSLLLEDLQGGGFTITNGGIYGSLLSTPILNPPQSGILGMHKIMKRAVVINDQIVIRSMMYVALSYDHRIIDGKEAVSFLITLKNCLEDPTRLVLDV